jgi:CheY-like chemotaxis protein
MDGWQFRTAQQHDARLSSIPVVVVTADGNAQQKARKINADGWVKKPIELDALLQVVERHCRSDGGEA